MWADANKADNLVMRPSSIRPHYEVHAVCLSVCPVVVDFHSRKRVTDSSHVVEMFPTSNVIFFFNFKPIGQTSWPHKTQTQNAL